MHVMVELRRDLTVGGDVEVFTLILKRQLELMERAIDTRRRASVSGRHTLRQ
jgi:hypothetical protein